MRYTQPGGVKRQEGGEYRVVIEVFLDQDERDLWGSGKARFALVPAEPKVVDVGTGPGLRHSGEIRVCVRHMGVNLCPGYSADCLWSQDPLDVKAVMEYRAGAAYQAHVDRAAHET
jgi:hypothetical protein